MPLTSKAVYSGMRKPIIITVEHHATKHEVVRKLKSSFGDIRAQIAPYVSSITEDWTDAVSMYRWSRSHSRS